MSVRSFLAAILFPLAGVAFGQERPYFQQEVDYHLEVTLNDVTRTVSGFVRIDYTNHSPDTLREIWMHLWGNAFTGRRTAFCQQKLDQGDAAFYFAADSLLGRFNGLAFEVDRRPVPWSYDPRHSDIAVLHLTEPLAPGGRLSIATPFELRVPASFSRLGHVGDSYQMTQWYPKPAVYDRRGWHPMPYLDQGEFYAEFGSFDVSITLPDNYVVGATGVLQTPEEQAFLHLRAEATRAMLDTWAREDSLQQKREHVFPPSSNRWKTLRFTADSVHDFAWFADKRFHVLKDTAVLASGRRVDCWAFFTDEERHLWRKGAFYVRRAVAFYSEHVGEYPWPQATAVHSALSAGGGMEYPMITVIGDAGNAFGLDEVIAHEVGHNWFYGILASNERDHPWLDEGLNSYYEQRYMRRYYGRDGMMDADLPDFIHDKDRQGSLLEIGYLFLARTGEDTPPDTRSDRMSPVAYGLQAYMKPALCLRWLEDAVGVERLDAAMQRYFRNWRFRHPYPEDLQASWSASGLEAGWFFEAMRTQHQADVALKRIDLLESDTFSLQLEQRGRLLAPFAVSALQGDSILSTEWFQPAPGRQAIRIFAPGADAFRIDAGHSTLDIDRKNNTRRVRGLLPGVEPLRIRPMFPVEDPTRTQIGVLPVIGWNQYDNTLLGLLFYRPFLPPRRFQYFIAPAIGTGSGRFAGWADLQWRLLRGPGFRNVRVGLNAKTFGYDYLWADRQHLRYYRLAPFARVEYRSDTRTMRHALQWRTLFIGVENARFDPEGAFIGTEFRNRTVHELSLEGQGQRMPRPFRYRIALERQAYTAPAGNAREQYLRLSAVWRQAYYYSPKRKVTARFFTGVFLENTRRNATSVSNEFSQASFALNPQGFNDYRYDEVFLGRTETSGLLSRQVSQTEGGFKNAFGAPYAGVIGNSNDFIVALNLKADLPADLPLRLPLRPYFDIGYYNAPPNSLLRPEDQLVWSGGFMLEFLRGGLEIYFPLVHSRGLRENYCAAYGGDRSALFCGGSYWKWVTWSIRLERQEPLDLAMQLARP